MLVFVLQRVFLPFLLFYPFRPFALHYTRGLNSYGPLQYFQNVCKLEPKANCICC